MDNDPCTAEILYSRDYPPLRRVVRELSPDGMLLSEAMIVPSGVPVTVRLSLPGEGRPLALKGRVEARPDPGGCEVRFTRPPRAARLAIQRFLERLTGR